MDKCKKVISGILLVFLSIVLVVVIIFMMGAIKNVKLEQKLLRSEVASLNEEISELLAKQETTAAETSTQVEKTEDLNQEKAELIRKLLLEKMPAFQFMEDGKYNVVGKYIDEIEIYSEPYYARLGDEEDTIENRVQWYKNHATKIELEDVDSVVAIGKVSFTTEFDKEVAQDDVVFAGGGHSIMLYKNYVVQSFFFELEKLTNGEYRISLNTGW